ncbi:hypothetical protein DM02DRAFT_512713 [Periconia macrospinosa]|uniref:Uncharacterized protein n=1 Tax=Periconia macrospinosa TaxID=97972 RepID=A0A2V1EDU1_9PLEO|nr:hypothetical protein DM02DRAFT_512713 [Periconia macrospinosa]
MSGPEKEAFPPSYSESITSSTAQPRHQNLVNHLTTVRTTHILTVIDSHILPLVEQQAAYGISETNIALLPSDVSLPTKSKEKSEFSFDNDDDAEKKIEIIGFSSDEVPKLVQLEGQMNKTEFWRAPGVIQDMEERLRGKLNAAAATAAVSSTQTAPSSAADTPRAVSKRGFLGKLANVIEQEKRSSPFAGGTGKEAGRVMVKVRLEEICLRTVNEFGLYDTLSKPCVMVRVDARC